MKVANRVGNV